jgi:site-specific DNA-methyltransferase (adenine-specific)
MIREDLADGVTLFCGDCRDILPSFGHVDAVVTDPPYGIGYKATQPKYIEYGLIIGDSEDFDPSPLLLISKQVILWGANNYANKLPFGGWIVWDKRCSEAADRMMGSPFELAWCSKAKLFKFIRLQHGGVKNADALNGDVSNEPRYHPTQKPIKLMQQCIKFLNDPCIILDPYMGSGSTGIAATKLGRRFIGIEIEERYFSIACRRIEEALRQPDMFIERPAETKQEKLAL